MTDYYPLLSRAVTGLEKNTGEARRALYERARNALVAQLRSTQPPLPEADITRERLALEDAVRKVEADEARRLRTPPGAGPTAPPPVAVGRPPEPPAQRPPVPRPEDLRRQPPGGAPSPPGPQSRTAPPPPSSSTPPPRTGGAPPPRPVVPAGMAPRPAEQRPPVPPGLATRPPEQRSPESRPPLPPPADPRRMAEPPRPRQAPPPERLPLEQVPYPPEPPPQGRRPPREMGYPQAGDLDEGYAPPPPPPPPPPSNEQPVRRRRPPGPAPRRPLADEKPANPARRGLIAAIVAILLISGLGATAFWQRDKISSIFNAAKNLAPSQTTSNQQRPKAPDRVGQDGQPAQSGTPALVAQRVVLYEEDPANPEGIRTSGSAIWRTETVSPGPGLAPELAVRADIEIPERKFAMTMSIRRNTDTALPASHTVEILFNLPADFSSGSIDKVPGILMKEAEQARGAPLAGLAVKVTNGFFLIGLSSAEADTARNLQLLKERAWFDVPMVYSNNRRAILAVEKGTPGERAFNEAFAAWAK